MSSTHLSVENFDSWKAYYWTYQYKLFELHYSRLFEAWGIQVKDKKILDIGCGNGGFTSAMADAGADCTGVEIRDFEWDKSRDGLRFLVQDILAENAGEVIGKDYDIILLRDVIEHIPLDLKSQFLEAVRQFSAQESKILLTFPPFYSPFGLHQQTFLKSFFRKIPYLSWIPGPILELALKSVGESEKALADTREIRECRMTLQGFKRLVKNGQFAIQNEKHFLVRPSHELRYGWKTRESNIYSLPLLREVLVLGSVFQLSAFSNAD